MESNISDAQAAYQNLCQRHREIAYLRSAGSLLDFDQETIMPPAALPHRARCGAYLSGRMHDLAIDPAVEDELAAAESGEWAADSVERANLREWRREYDRARRLPRRLVEELQEASSLARQAWAQARANARFDEFKPALSRLLELCREKAEAVGYEESPYDALLEDYEPGLRCRKITPLFAELREALKPLVAEGSRLSREINPDHWREEYPVEKQMEINRTVAEAVGFDFSSGLLTVTLHPFCSSIGPGDVRLTTRYDPRDFTSSLFGVLHEAGHGLYAQGLNPEQYGFPCGSSVSLGIDESQSRLWENHVGRSAAFWEKGWEIVGNSFPELQQRDRQEFLGLINRICPSYIRVEADEVTYDLHILLRFELEKALIEGDLKLEELPGEWNRRFKEWFGLEVPDDARGCLQDIHWSLGAFGYFPTYTLGNMAAAQIFAAAKTALPDLETDLAQWNHEPLLEWLRREIHQHGSRYVPEQLLQKVTGSELHTEPYLAHLQGKLSLLEAAG